MILPYKVKVCSYNLWTYSTRVVRVCRENKTIFIVRQYNYYTSQAEGWISEKLTVATDESYRDPTNLQSKLQKHGAFEAELSANKGRVDSVTEVRISHSYSPLMKIQNIARFLSRFSNRWMVASEVVG